MRIGYFEQFSGADTILFSFDKPSLTLFFDTVEKLIHAKCITINLTDLPLVESFNQIRLSLKFSTINIGLYQDSNGYVLELDKEGWIYVSDLLTPLLRSENGHQYVDFPIRSDDLQIILSLNEYPNDWIGWTDLRTDNL